MAKKQPRDMFPEREHCQQEGMQFGPSNGLPTDAENIVDRPIQVPPFKRSDFITDATPYGMEAADTPYGGMTIVLGVRK